MYGCGFGFFGVVVVVGVFVVKGLFEGDVEIGDVDLFCFVIEFEGYFDNVVLVLFGGFMIVWMLECGL